jgi:hypothetical protein
MELNRWQKAALVSNTNRSKKSIENYNNNPNKCECCGETIHLKPNQKVSVVRKKRFCNSSCSASFNNKRRDSDVKDIKNTIKRVNNPFNYIIGVTKQELREKKGVYYKFRSVIRKHAYYLFMNSDIEKKCKVCGYERHIEVCHIKPVSEFNGETLITDINKLNNLIALCPNHHWEFDAGVIKI